MTLRILLTILLNALALYAVSYFLGDDLFSISPTAGYIAVAIVLGILNAVIKPILSLLSLPFMLMSFGAFLAVINMVLLWLCVYLFANVLDPLGVIFTISGGVTTYLVAALILSVLNTVFYFLIKTFT